MWCSALYTPSQSSVHGYHELFNFDIDIHTIRIALSLALYQRSFKLKIFTDRHFQGREGTLCKFCVDRYALISELRRSNHVPCHISQPEQRTTKQPRNSLGRLRLPYKINLDLKDSLSVLKLILWYIKKIENIKSFVSAAECLLRGGTSCNNFANCKFYVVHCIQCRQQTSTCNVGGK